MGREREDQFCLRLSRYPNQMAGWDGLSSSLDLPGGLAGASQWKVLNDVC